MQRRIMRSFLAIALLLSAAPSATSFLPQPKSTGILLSTSVQHELKLFGAPSTAKWTSHKASRPLSVCFMAKRKKRPMEEMLDEGLASAPSTKKVRKQKKKKTKATNSTRAKSSTESTTGGGVSPLLSQWATKAAKSEDSDEETEVIRAEETVAEDTESDYDDAATTFVAFEPSAVPTSSKRSNNKRRVRQAERLAQEGKVQQRILKMVEDLEDVLENQKGSSEPILGQVKKLMEVESPSLRQLTAGKTRLNYRLAWVGSDQALCHIGTGLHKVPLARMQEVFLTFQGRNELEVLEVISILGPFPNVRNTLQGNCMEMKSGDEFTEWTVRWESMIDGTGKEILAGEEVRKVPLQVYFSDKNALVAVVPDDENVSDPLADNGKNVLVFVREEDLDGKLSKNRVL